MQGTIAITDYGWYDRLRAERTLEEVNFWKPTATRTFRAEEFSPFLFKLRKEDGDRICGFGYFARYSRLPDWLAWEAFGVGNGCGSLDEMRARIAGIRDRISFKGLRPLQIGCILIVQPVFFPPGQWVAPPRDWPARTQVDKKYDLDGGEGRRVWEECLAAAPSAMAPSMTMEADDRSHPGELSTAPTARYGSPHLIRPRLGQGTFRIAVTDAYGRGCAVTEEHSLPVLEAAHIKPYGLEGPHEVANGLLLRADLHRLFDQGYITVTPELKLEVGQRLREDFANGRTYYPLHGHLIRLPNPADDRPSMDYIRWHNENRYLG